MQKGLLEELMNKKEELHEDLVDHIDEDSPIGVFLRHPLLMTLYVEDMNAYYNHQYLGKKKECDKALKNKKWNTWIWLHERPFRLDAFLFICRDIPAEEYWSLLRDIWIDTEGPGVNQDIWLELFNRPYPKRRKMMTGKERRALASAGRASVELNIYRGYVDGLDPEDSEYIEEDRDRESGISWTLDYNKAEWFARRFLAGGTGYGVVAEAICNPKDVIAYFESRGEKEIVIDPSKVRILRSQALPTEEETQKEMKDLMENGADEGKFV